MKQFHLSFLQSGCRCGTRIHSFLSTLYIASIFHIFKKRTNSLSSPIFISTLSFVDNGLFISQEKSYEKSNTNLFCSYSIIFSLFDQFGLVIEHNKSEVFHFSRAMKNTKLSFLNLRPLEGPCQNHEHWTLFYFFILFYFIFVSLLFRIRV